jgi:hypothetical protein
VDMLSGGMLSGGMPHILSRHAQETLQWLEL